MEICVLKPLVVGKLSFRDALMHRGGLKGWAPWWLHVTMNPLSSVVAARHNEPFKPHGGCTSQ